MGSKTQLAWLLFSLLCLATVLVYTPGIGGPFIFDDTVHITKNKLVHIEGLGFDSLVQAWHSSPASFPSNRPLSQLTFGVNHAVAGLSPSAYKIGNLLIHLANGLLVFLLARRLGDFLALRRPELDAGRIQTLALATAAFWLLAPINLTPVLYAVQRMTSLSAFFVFLALLLYLEGRWRSAAGSGGTLPWLLGSLGAALLGVFAKENAVLFPLYVLVLEWTLLREADTRVRVLRLAAIGSAVVVIGAGLAYLALHPQMISFAGRDFSLEERLLTQARALWMYVQMALIPQPGLFGFYHDDFALSTRLTSPSSTLPAVVGVVAALAFAIVAAKRLPVFAFACLFFLAGHALESSIFPLELVFEHRNYLPVFGLFFGLAYLLTVWPTTARMRIATVAATVVLVALQGTVTYLRAQDWSSVRSLVLAQVEHHPNSPRANFHAAQLMINWLPHSEDPAATYAAAREFLIRIRQLDPDNLDALFGLIVLNLSVSLDPNPQWVGDLLDALPNGPVGPTKITTSQFSHLVIWHMGEGHRLQPATVRAIFEAALANPRHDRYARAGINSAYRAYLDRVLNLPAEALPYAEAAVAAWPQRWHYHRRLIEVLLRLHRIEQANAAFERALGYDPHGMNQESAQQLREAIAAAREAGKVRE